MIEPMVYWSAVVKLYDEAKKHCRDLEGINEAFRLCKRMMEDCCATQSAIEVLKEELEAERGNHLKMMKAKNAKIEYWKTQSRMWMVKGHEGK